MGNTNYGNQIMTIQYHAPADSDVVNRRNMDIEARGIYKGGLLAKISDTQVSVSPLVCEIGDDTNQLRIETQESVTINVGTGTPYIVLRWTYVAAVDNYMDVLAVSSPQENDLVVGKAVYAGSTLTGFDYSERDVVMKFKEFLKVVPTEPPSMKVHIKGGWTSYGTKRLFIPEQDSSFTIVAPTTNPRIDYIYVDDSGLVQLEVGTESATPEPPDYSNRVVLAEITVSPGQTEIAKSHITDTRMFIQGRSNFAVYAP